MIKKIKKIMISMFLALFILTGSINANYFTAYAETTDDANNTPATDNTTNTPVTGGYDSSPITSVFEKIGYSAIYNSESIEHSYGNSTYQKSIYISSTGIVCGAIISPVKEALTCEILYDGLPILNQVITDADWFPLSPTEYYMPIKLTPTATGTVTFKFTFDESAQFVLYVGQQPSDTGSNESGNPLTSPDVSISEIKPYITSSSFIAYLTEYPADIDGVEYKVYKKDGTDVYGSTTKNAELRIIKANAKAIYYVKTRSFMYDNNYNKVYSNWSDKKYFISSPSIDAVKTRSTITKHSLTLSWGKVTGAKKYIVYCSTKKDSGYKEVGTTTKTSLAITKFNSKTISLANKKYFKVVASTEIKDETVESIPYEYMYCQFY